MLKIDKKRNVKKIFYKIVFILLLLSLVLIKNTNAKSDDEKLRYTLIVETEDESIFNEYKEISEVKEIFNDIYFVDYLSDQDAEIGYQKLKENKNVKNICRDKKISIPEKIKDKKDNNNSSNSNNVSSLSVDPENYAWGVNSTGINHYLTKLKNVKNKNEIKIGVLDTGIRSTHEAFYDDTGKSRLDLTNSYNYVNNKTDITDDQGHGTEVAGIIAQSTLDNVKIVPVKVLDSLGYGNLRDIFLAIANIYDKVDIINLSLGIIPEEIDASSLSICESVLKEVYDSGVIIICASGNDGKDFVYYPASSQYTIAASSIDKYGSIAYFSNYGEEIDFALPGVDLKCPYYISDYAYKIDSGTSFSSPFLSAAIAMIKTEYPRYSISKIKEILENNAEDLGVFGKDQYYGYGKLNFDIEMFKNPEIYDVKVSKEEGKVTAYAFCGSNLISYAVTKENIAPSSSDFTYFETLSKDVEFDLDINIKDYGNYYVWVKNINGTVTSKKFEVPIFYDVSNSNWYYNAVKYCYENNIIRGLNDYYFGPNDKLTRAMMVTILYRMEGGPNLTGESTFSDVQDSTKYYYKSVVWAANNNIVSGYQDGRFGPTDNITREQLAVILWKYARYKEKDLSKTDDLNGFSDANKVASYATTQVKWAVGSGVITGSNGKLNPKGNASRAEVSAMMEKYCKRVGR